MQQYNTDNKESKVNLDAFIERMLVNLNGAYHKYEVEDVVKAYHSTVVQLMLEDKEILLREYGSFKLRKPIKRETNPFTNEKNSWFLKPMFSFSNSVKKLFMTEDRNLNK